MGMNSFAPYLKINGCFIVQNISPQVKTIKIFNYPINYMDSRDLLQIPGISESDIRASLLKGEINHKIRAKDITVICSDIDLLQFNNNHKLFLQSAGIINGLTIGVDNISQDLNDFISSGGAGGLTASQHEVIRQAIHFIDEGPGDGFSSGAYKSIIGQPFPTNITWYFDNTQAKKIVEKLIVRNSSQNPTNITWNIYDTDGITIVHSVSDNIGYNSNSIEINRTRTII